MNSPRQLISYIAPGAPATRRPAEGNEPFLRPEIGFTPAWYRQHLDISFGERFILEGKSRFAHTDFGLVSGIRPKQARFYTPNMLCGPLNGDSLRKA